MYKDFPLKKSIENSIKRIIGDNLYGEYDFEANPYWDLSYGTFIDISTKDVK